MEELPILGKLVQMFRINASGADSGRTAADSRATLTMEREGDMGWLASRYEQSSAGRHHAEFISFLKTITLILPETERVEILPKLSHTQDTNRYIKPAYTVEGRVDRAAMAQPELESDTDVQLRKYQGPGSIAIRLTSAEDRLDTIYSLRALPMDNPEVLRSVAVSEEGTYLLWDNIGRFFMELGQYDTRGEAEQATGGRGVTGLIVG